MKSFIGRALVVVAALTLIIGISILKYFKKNEAPILQGELDFNIEFKTDLELDVYQPTQIVFPQSPVLVYVHGGGWMVGAKTSVNNARFNQAFNRLRNKGYAIISPNYTLATHGQTPFPACIEDIEDALAWIVSHAETHNFDLTNVGLLGESAGGHLALMAGLNKDKLNGFAPSLSIPYIIDIYGPADLLQLYEDQSFIIDSIQARTSHLPNRIQDHLDLRQYLFGFLPEEDEKRMKAFTSMYSPIKLVKNTAPEILIVHGDQDRVVPVNQSEILKAKLDSLSVKNEMHILKGVDHAFRNASNMQKQNVQDWIVGFVERHYVPNLQ